LCHPHKFGKEKNSTNDDDDDDDGDDVGARELQTLTDLQLQLPEINAAINVDGRRF